MKALLARLRARVVAFAREVLAAHASPRSLALAMIVGAIAGCTPFFGFHLFLCIALAWLFRLNQAAVYAAANISIPPLAPLVGFASVECGERLLHGRWLPLTVEEFRHPAGGIATFAGHFFVDWLAGALVVGGAVGLVLAAVVYPLASRRAALHKSHAALHNASAALQQSAAALQQEAIDAALSAASDRYRAAPRSMRWYAFFKYRMDPCYRRLAALVPEGSLTVDLGSGLGMLPVLLGVLGGGREAVGVEWDARKVQAGRSAASGLSGVRLEEGDARAFIPPACDTVTIVDMLHYFDVATQQAILARAEGALRPGGRILIREGDAGKRGGAGFTRWLERLAVRLGWNRAPGATGFRAANDLRSALESLGLCVTVEPVSGRLHPGNVLIRATRKEN